MDMPLEMKALNILGLIEKPKSVWLSPQRALMVVMAATLSAGKYDPEYGEVTGPYSMTLFKSILRSSTFTDAAILELFEGLHQFHPEIAVPTASELGQYRDEVRHPFHEAALSQLAQTILRMLSLCAVDRKQLSKYETARLVGEIMDLGPAACMLCEMVARCDFGPARRQVIDSVETLMTCVPKDNDLHLMLTGIVVQQKKAAQ